jgi:hypothetical protein
MRRLVTLGFAAFGTVLTVQTVAPLHAGEIPGAILELRAATPFAPLQDWSAAPPRFVLMEDGQVFVGGSKDLLSGRLEKNEVKSLEEQAESVRKMPGLASVVAFGDGEEPSFHLRAGKGKALEVRATGDPAKAGPALRPLAAFLDKLLRFDHPSLRAYLPASLAVFAREGPRRGGCRIWTLLPTPKEAAAGTTIQTSAASTWGGGVYPTSVCVGDKVYEVRLRPLLPGERP